MINFDIQQLHFWQASLNNFGKQRISWFSGKTWDDCITKEPLLLGKAPRVLEKKINDYWQKPPLIRWILARITSIQREEKLFQYYLNRQSFNSYLKTLSDDQQKILTQPYFKKSDLIQEYETPLSSPVSFFDMRFIKRLWPFQSKVLLNKADSQLQRIQTFNEFMFEASKVYRNHQQHLEVIYTQSHLTFEICTAKEEALAKQRKSKLSKLQNKYIKDIKLCITKDKETFISDIKSFFATAEKFIYEKVSEMSFHPTTSHGTNLRQRYFEPYALVKIEDRSFNTVSIATSFFNDPKPKRLEELRQAFKSNPPVAVAAIKTWVKDYCTTAAAYINQLSLQGQQLMDKARTEFKADNSKEELLAIQLKIKEAYENSVKQINLFFRHTIIFLHPDKRAKYSALIAAEMAQGCEQLTSFKNQQIIKLSTALKDLSVIQIEEEQTNTMEQQFVQSKLRNEKLTRELVTTKQELAIIRQEIVTVTHFAKKINARVGELKNDLQNAVKEMKIKGEATNKKLFEVMKRMNYSSEEICKMLPSFEISKYPEEKVVSNMKFFSK